MRFRRPSAVAALAIALIAGCAPKMLTPKRPPKVPAAATWVAGADGGAWVDCHSVAGASHRFDCIVYNDRTGAPHAKGAFVPDFDPGRIPLQFHSYDGGGRLTLSDTTHFLAVGFVDFPSGDGHGHKMKYNSGEPVGPDSTY